MRPASASPQDLHHLELMVGIQRRRGFVDQQEWCRLCQCAGQQHAGTFATRQAVDRPCGQTLDPGCRHRPVYGGAVAGPSPAAKPI